MTYRKNTIIKIFQSRIFLIILLLITIISALRLSNEIIKRNKINNEISRLKNQMQQLRNEQKSLSSLLNYLQSDAYIEEEARKKFNLAKPGETIIVINNPTDNNNNVTKSSNDNVINHWWGYFFNNK